MFSGPPCGDSQPTSRESVPTAPQGIPSPSLREPTPATAPLSLNSVLPVTIVSCIEGLAPWLGMLFGQVPEAYEVGPSCRKQVTGAISCLAALPVPLSVSVAQSVSSPPHPSLATLR